MNFERSLSFIALQIIEGKKDHFFIRKNKCGNPFITAAQENLGFKIPMDEDMLIFVVHRKALEQYANRAVIREKTIDKFKQWLKEREEDQI